MTRELCPSLIPAFVHISRGERLAFRRSHQRNQPSLSQKTLLKKFAEFRRSFTRASFRSLFGQTFFSLRCRRSFRCSLWPSLRAASNSFHTSEPAIEPRERFTPICHSDTDQPFVSGLLNKFSRIKSL